MMGAFKDIAGLRFNRLTAVRRVVIQNGATACQGTRWECLCDCGSTYEASYSNLASGSIKSCGCLKTERNMAKATHGMSESSEYRSWSGMMQRCFNKNNPRYSDYGGRGISVCDRWLLFDNFISDMGTKPSKKHSLDRLNNNGSYSPENCRWASDEQQRINQRRNRTIEFGGVTKTLKEWCVNLGLSYPKTRDRLFKLHWSTEKAFCK